MQLAIATTSGTVRGIEKAGVRTWRGIPYAAAPVGPLRFGPPQPAPRWDGERDASRFGPVAPQARDAMLSGIGEKAVLSEDCLTVNVIAPADAREGCPVVVWIHGGAFIMGASSMPLYNGTSFAQRHGIITVTLNYRLGLLGLLYLGDLGGDAAGNACLLDQLAALHWVQENIAAFGGNPADVTVMGESAGAVSVATLLAMPAARGLFHRAILQSGASPFEPPDRTAATQLARSVLAELGCADAAAVRAAPVDAILALQLRWSKERGIGAFTPYVDGVSVPRAPLAAVRAGEGIAVPLLLGSNRDEWNLFDQVLPGSTAALRGAIERRLGAAMPAVRAAYASWVDLVGDVAFRIPMLRLAEAQPAPVHVYRFDLASPMFGAAHALELPFMWNNLDQPFARMLLGGEPAELQPLADAMHATWAAFIARGDPNGAGLPAWPRYELPARQTMLIDRGSRVADDPGGEQRAQWELFG